MDKQLIKKAIEYYEQVGITAMGKLCGIDVKVVNVKVLKNKAIADVIVIAGGEKIYRENKVNYPYKMFTNNPLKGFSIGGENRNVKNNSKM